MTNEAEKKIQFNELNHRALVECVTKVVESFTAFEYYEIPKHMDHEECL